MQWKNDLVCDIRFENEMDNQDGPLHQLHMKFSDYAQIHPPVCFSKNNHIALLTAMNYCKYTPQTFLEIGVDRNDVLSSTRTLMNAVPHGGIYLGVDIEDKSYLNNPSKGIHTLKTSSSNYDEVVLKLKSLGVSSIDFIFIDGLHSINQVLADWEFTKLLSDGGVVALHDTTSHPGPYFFINAIDKKKWNVFPNLCPDDHGFGFCFKKQS